MVFVALTVVALAADLWTKAATWDYFGIVAEFNAAGIVSLTRTGASDDLTFIPNGLEITAVANQGAAMGLGQGKKLLFLSVSAVAVVVLIAFFTHSVRSPSMRGWYLRLYRATLAMLLAGVLGNFYDRIVHGYVRDMLHALPRVTWADVIGRWDTPIFPWVFNLADVYLCVGVGLVLFFGLFGPSPLEEKPSVSTEG